jgi:protein gp37
MARVRWFPCVPTKIEWTDESWNPVTGCVKVSPGCKHCYAERFAERFRGTPRHPYSTGFTPTLRPERIDHPLRWRSPRMVFVNSMSDLFGDFVPDWYIERVFDVMRRTPQHTYQVLTKRAQRMASWTRTQTWLENAPHIWLGVSVEDERYGLPRVHHLRHARAAVRFLSVEPLLEGLPTLNVTGLDWVIVGGESGPGARPLDPRWVRGIRDRCMRAGVAFFFKQWGGVQKKRAGRVLDGETWDQFPTVSGKQENATDAKVRRLVPRR